MNNEPRADDYRKNYSNPTYSTWKHITDNVKKLNERYGVAITRSARWEKFENFVNDMGPRPQGKVLSRHKFFGDYSLQNCCWKSRSECVIANRPEFVDYMIARTYGNWTVLAFMFRRGNHRYYVCRCTKCRIERIMPGEMVREVNKRPRCRACKAQS